MSTSTGFFYTMHVKSSTGGKESMWERTGTQCLLRNKQSGLYYGRFTLHGKQKWYALETDVYSVAKLRVGDKAVEVERLRGTLAHVAAGKATVGELMEVYISRTKANPDFRPATVAVRLVGLNKVKKTWPGIERLEPRQITPAGVFAWVAQAKGEAAGYVPPGATKAVKGNSASSINRAIDTLRRVLDIAIERGQIHGNPVLVKPPVGRLKKKVVSRKLVLPSMAQVRALFTAMEKNGSPGGWGAEAADFCRFMTYSGARIGEAARTTWQCVDWERKQMRIPGYKSATSDRQIPLFPGLGALLKRMVKRRKSAARFAADRKPLLEPGDPLFRLTECQKTIDAACAKTGVPRLTHHDFRHLFATVCIESGVDIPTVAAWLGHNDGGVLAMKTYGHLRREHSFASAAKVRME